MVKKSGMKSEIEALSRDKLANLHKGRFKEVAEICNYLGELLKREERYEDAIGEHETELEMCVKTRDRLGQAIANRRIGECHCALNDFEKALRFQQKHLDIAQELNSDIEQQRAHATIGRTYMVKAEGADNMRESLRKAKEAFKSSLNFAVILKSEMETTEYSLMVGRLYLNLGILSEMNGSLRRAVRYIKEALVKMQEANQPEDELKCQNMLSSISLNLGEMESSEELAQAAYAIAKQLKNKPAIGEALLLRASVAVESEKFVEARHCLKRLLKTKSYCEENKPKAKKMLMVLPKLESSHRKLNQLSNSSDRIKILDQVADDYCSVECYYSAGRFYKQMLEEASESGAKRSELAEIYVSLAQTSADLRNYADAIRYFREEVKLRDDPEQLCRTWLNIADFTERGEERDGADVAILYDKATVEAEKSGKRKLILQCLSSQQVLYRGLGDVDRIADIEDKMRKLTPLNEEESDQESEAASSRSESPNTEDMSSLTESDEEFGVNDGNSSSTIKRRDEYKVKRNDKGETLLHIAVIAGNLKRVKQLIAAGHPVNERDNCGWLPIHEAANHSRLEIATFLIEHNALLNDRGLKGCSGLTPIQDAASAGNLEMVQLLHNKGADVACMDDKGNTIIDTLHTWRRENFDDKQEKMDAHTETVLGELIGVLQAAMIQGGMRPGQLRSIRHQGTSHASGLQSPDVGTARKNRLPNQEGSRSGRCPSPHLDSEGATMYQAAIDSMRGSTFRKRKEKRKRTPSPLYSAATDGGLIRAEEFIGDNWLIEDMDVTDGPRVSRDAAGILFTSGARELTAKRKPFSTGIGKTASSRSSSDLIRSRIPTGVEEHASMDIECIDVVTKPSRSGVDRELANRDSYRTKEITSIFPLPSSSMPVATSSPRIQPSAAATPALPAINPFSRFRVRIGELVILVPVALDQDRTIGWLSDEAALRYSDLKGIKPTLQLKTQDGAVLSALDLVRDVVTQSEEIVGIAESWHSPPTSERYAKCCLTTGTPELENLRQALLTACETGVLSVADSNISGTSAGPLFRSLQFQTNIRQILVESNPIGDFGFQSLMDGLPSLQNITHLELACVDITNVSLESLKRSLTAQTPKCLPCLSDLNLSHNYFTDVGLDHISDIISELPCLTTLNLEGCGFTRNFLDRREMAFRTALAKPSRLRSLSLAWNDLEAKGAGRILSILPDGLSALNISGCLSKGSPSLHTVFDSGESHPPIHLDSLSLAFSQLSAETFADLVRVLQGFTALRTVNISRNNSLGPTEMAVLLGAVSRAEVQWVTIDVSGISAVKEVIPTLIQAVENSLLREIILTIEDDLARTSLIHHWETLRGGKAHTCAGTPTVHLYR